MNASRRILPALMLLALAAGCGPGAVREEGAAGAAEPLDAAKVIEHTVAAGETLGQVADNYYGDPARARQVATDNGLGNADQVAAGSVLRLRFSDAEWSRARQRASALGPYNRGVGMLASGRLAEAEDAFRLALATAPDLTSARYNLALVLVQRGHNDEALTLLEELTTARPGDADFRFARGHALFAANRPAEAVQQFRQVLAGDPAHRRAAFGLARALEETGDVRAAVAAWERYLVLDPDSGWADQARSRLRALRHAG